jgi:hypothetical protein
MTTTILLTDLVSSTEREAVAANRGRGEVARRRTDGRVPARGRCGARREFQRIGSTGWTRRAEAIRS